MVSGKASVETDIEGKTNSLNFDAHKKDSIIWISISPLLGIEYRGNDYARSVKFMDRTIKIPGEWL